MMASQGKKFFLIILILWVMASFPLTVSSNAFQKPAQGDKFGEITPNVRVRPAQSQNSSSQKERCDILIIEGKKLFTEEMDYEGAVRKFEEAKKLALTREQKADVYFYLSLVYYLIRGEKEKETYTDLIHRLLELDYYREPDELLCPPRYIEIFRAIKKLYGALKIQSNPSGAEVHINRNKESSGKTPLIVGIRAGVVRIDLRTGKLSSKKKIEVRAEREYETPFYSLKRRSSFLFILGGTAVLGGGVALLYFSKEMSPTYGSIQVNSTPTGANVYLDGTDTGQATNCLLTDVTEGSHTIKIVKEGFVDAQQNVTVVKDQTVTVNVILSLHAITVNNPSSETIWVTGEDVEINWAVDETLDGFVSRLTAGQRGTFLSIQQAKIRQPFLRAEKVTEKKVPDISSNQDRMRADVQGNISGISSQDMGRYAGPQRSREYLEITHNRLNKESPGAAITSKALSAGFPPVKSSNSMRLMTLSNIKIELYKADVLAETVTESTSNSGSYTWNVPASLAMGIDYRVRVSCADEASVSGESENFLISPGYEYVTQWGTGDLSNNKVHQPQGIAVDSLGNVYVADTLNHRIMKFSSSGEFLAKWGSIGYGNYQFYEPVGVAVSISGDVYVTDTKNHRIVKFTSDGSYVNQWGTWGDSDYQFKDPRGIAVDVSGNIYVADMANNRIMKFTSNGGFLAKWGSEGSGDYQFWQPRGIAIDHLDQVYVADTLNNRIMKYTSEGQFITKWGSHGGGDFQFNGPFWLSVDGSDNLYIADAWNHRVSKFSSDGQFITKWGSQGSGNYQFCGPQGTAADGSGYVYISDTVNNRIMKFTSDGIFVGKWGNQDSGNFQLSHPKGVAVDLAGHVYVSDTDNYRIMKYSSNGNFIKGWECEGGYHTSSPHGLAVDSMGNVYVAERWNHRIMKFSSDGMLIMQWGRYGSGDYEFKQPYGIAIDSSGNIYVCELESNRVIKFNSDGVFIKKWGSEGSGNYQLKGPYAIAVDSNSNVYVADHGNNRIVKFTSDGEFIKSWGTQGMENDQFSGPSGIAVDGSDNIYVADMWNHRVSKFSSDGQFITKWGSQGSGNDQFNRPWELVVDSSGNVYVADTYNNRIMKFSPLGGGQPTMNSRKNLATSPLIQNKNTEEERRLKKRQTAKRE